MTTYYKPLTVKTGSLKLDPKNARLPVEHRSDNQRALLQALLELEDVRGLAKSIAKLGVFPNERLVVMREAKGRKYIVLEGNRRLAAAKLLINPELAPTDTEVKAFRRLAESADIPALGKLDVVVVNDRISAAPIISALHVGQAKRRWSSLQQARFFSELVKQGQSIADVAEELGTTIGHVQGYLRAELLHELALSLDLAPEDRRAIADANFPLTTLERFIESKVGRKALGIELTDEGGFRGTVHPERFKAVLRRVATDVAKVKGFTRQVNEDSGIREYFEKIEGNLPATRKRGNFDPQVLLGRAPKASTDDEPPKSPAPRKPRKSSSIIPIGYACTSKHERVRKIFGEIRSLKLSQHRNATVIMLRVLVDIALWRFIEDKGLETEVCDHFDPNKKQRKYNPHWTPPLRDLISYMVDKKKFPGMSAAGYKATRMLVSRDAQHVITIEGFNAFTHNPHMTPMEEELRALWTRAEPLLDIILA